MPAQFLSRTWQVDDGLPHATVRAITQTRDGFLWLGTQDGLAQFDGQHFTVYSARNVPELKGQQILALAETGDGALWFGGEDSGLLRLQNGRFTAFGLRQGAVNLRVRELYETRDGILWIGTMDGLCRYQNGRFTAVSMPAGHAGKVIRGLCEDSEGHLWVATEVGLLCQAGGEFVAHPWLDLPINRLVRSICFDGQRNFWVATMTGLTRIAPDGTPTHFTKGQGLPENAVFLVRADRRGQVWIGCPGGLYRLEDGRFVTEYNSQGETYDQVNALFEDNEGNLWVGGKDGLSRLTPRVLRVWTRQQGLSHNNVMSVLESRTGDVWLGTWGGGLNILRNGSITPVNPGGALRTDLMLALHECADGTLWVGTEYNGGIYLLKDGVVTKHYGKEDGLPENGITVIKEDRSGQHWIGTSSGLCRMGKEPGPCRRYTVAQGLAGDLVRDLVEDKDGALWVGTTAGLSRFQNGVFKNFYTTNGLSRNHISCLRADPDGMLWIGTRGGGLNWRRNGQFGSCGSPQGLMDATVFEMLEDERGGFWLSTMKGIIHIPRRALQDFMDGKTPRLANTLFGRAEGMVSTMGNGVARPAGWKGKDGQLWFATTKGLVGIDPDMEDAKDRHPPPVHLEGFLRDGEKLGVTGKQSCPVGRGQLEFSFTAIHWRAPEKIRFRYRLEGVDDGWQEAGTRRVAVYNHVAPGTYRFLVTASAQEGVWNEQPAAVELTLTPHLWQTQWFLLLSACGLLGTVAATVRLVSHRKLQHRLEKLEQQHAVEKERARIAQDMHDELGASLTRITLLGELIATDKEQPVLIAEHSGKIVTSARETVRSLDEIVWAVNPHNDTLNSLVAYISHYADEFFENTDVRCRLEMPEEAQDYPLSSEMRHSLFLAVKESLNNVLKHASASEVTIQMKVAKETLQIRIADNGRGFDPDAKPVADARQGNGLVNLQTRLEEMGGTCTLTSRPGRGTVLNLEVKLRG